LNLLHNHIYFS